MDTLERAKEIARLYDEIEALTEQLAALLEGTPRPTKKPLDFANYGRMKKAQTCGKCGKEGHNARKCTEGQDNGSLVLQETFEQIKRCQNDGLTPEEAAEAADLAQRGLLENNDKTDDGGSQ